MSADFEDWQEQNREHLALAIDALHLRIEGASEEERLAVEAQAAELEGRMERTPALQRLADTFELEGFALEVVLLCAAWELDPRFHARGASLTVGYALETLPGAHWAALDVAAPLRYWGIVETDDAASIAATPIHLVEDVTRYLLGFDPRTGDGAVFSPPPGRFVELPGQLSAARDLARTIALTTAVTGVAPVVEVWGAAAEDRLALSELCAAELGASAAEAGALDLPPAGPDLDALLTRWNRLGPLTATLLIISGADDREDPAARQAVARAMHRLRQPLFLSVTSPTPTDTARPVVRREAPELTVGERLETWSACLDAARERLGLEQAEALRAEIAKLAVRFRFGARSIERICLEAEALHESDEPDASGPAERLARLLREGCSRTVRERLDPLAERLPLRNVPDLELPDLERRQIEELEQQVRLSHRVDVEWGLGRGFDTGVTALFAGPSGTGKTHAAMALARRLDLDLYRVNVAGVLSKYIGETEQNLDRIFEAARAGGVILLFDEADALFGKRSEVKDAHDRYANLGTAYLLQRIETAPTPTILTSNLKESIDHAFTRRLNFIVDFPFPRAPEREQIWRAIYPPDVPTRGLEPALLAQLSVTGGTIGNIARGAAFLAACEDEWIEMRHLYWGALSELRKLDREPSAEETAGWL